MIGTALRVFLCAGTIAVASAAWAGERVALVIGNGGYRHVPELPNARNDGRLVAAALKDLGFEVLEGIDVDMERTGELVRRFARRIDGAEVALFYYAGHGLQVNGENYLVPVDARLERPEDLDWETLPASRVVSLLDSRERTNIVILDACRNNPFARRLARGATRGIRVASGLADMRGGLGTLIAFATEPNDVALDGDGANSPFTEALVRHMREPGFEIRQLMTLVRRDVVQATDGEQVPWDHSSLLGDFYFLPPDDALPASRPQTVARREPPAAANTTVRDADPVAPPAPAVAARPVASPASEPPPHTIVQCRGPKDPVWVQFRLVTYAQCRAIGGSWTLP